jgi:hypothetical protein
MQSLNELDFAHPHPRSSILSLSGIHWVNAVCYVTMTLADFYKDSRYMKTNMSFHFSFSKQIIIASTHVHAGTICLKCGQRVGSLIGRLSRLSQWLEGKLTARLIWIT